MRPQRATVVIIAISVAFFAIAAAYTAHDGLASFADDSVSYLVMAQYFAPFHAVTPAIAHAYPGETNYPPAFALLLALFGGAHDWAVAHRIVVACLAVALVAGFFWFRRETESPVLALLMASLFASMPVVWMNLQGILSECLYLLVSLLFVLAYERSRPLGVASRRRLALLGALLALAVLTRNVGVALVGAYGVTVWLDRAGGGRWRWSAYLPIMIAILAALTWLWLRPSGWSGLYAEIIAALLDQAGESPGAVTNVGVLPQLAALYPAWASSFLMYWTADWTVRDVIVLGLAALTVFGLVRRLLANRIDAWYVALYLAIVLVWPTGLQMQRFLFPVMPFLLLSLVEALRWLASFAPAHRSAVAAAVLAVTMIAVTAPALGFFYFRYTADSDARYRYIAEYYRVPDLPGARAKAAQHIGLFEDMAALAESTPPASTIAWYMPGYVALLAGRKAVPMPPIDTPANFFRYLVAHDVDYIFLSRLHPRETLDRDVLDRWLGYFTAISTPVWRRMHDQTIESMLLRLDREALAHQHRMIAGPPAAE